MLQVCDNAGLEALDAPGFERLGRRAAELGVVLELGLRGLTPDNLARHEEACAASGARLLRIVIDGPECHPTLDEAGALLAAHAAAWERLGIRVAIENHDRFPVAQLAAMLRGVGSPRLGACLDTANSIGCGEGLREVVAALAPITFSLHLKDVSIRRLAHNMGFEVAGVATGDGQIDLAHAVRAVGATGLCDAALLELWVPPAGDEAATRARETAWRARGAAHVRRLISA